jgi:hypothetical protein
VNKGGNTGAREVAIRNYYLKLLHQIGSIKYRDKSNVISTSKNYSTAKKFAKGWCAGEGAIIHAWEPRSSSISVFKEYSLPRYIGRPYNSTTGASVPTSTLLFTSNNSGITCVYKFKRFVTAAYTAKEFHNNGKRNFPNITCLNFFI